MAPPACTSEVARWNQFNLPHEALMINVRPQTHSKLCKLPFEIMTLIMSCLFTDHNLLLSVHTIALPRRAHLRYIGALDEVEEDDSTEMPMSPLVIFETCKFLRSTLLPSLQHFGCHDLRVRSNIERFMAGQISFSPLHSNDMLAAMFRSVRRLSLVLLDHFMPSIECFHSLESITIDYCWTTSETSPDTKVERQRVLSSLLAQMKQEMTEPDSSLLQHIPATRPRGALASCRFYDEEVEAWMSHLKYWQQRRERDIRLLIRAIYHSTVKTDVDESTGDVERDAKAQVVVVDADSGQLVSHEELSGSAARAFCDKMGDYDLLPFLD